MTHFAVLRKHIGIISILFAYVLLATYYSVAVPIFETPDETTHYAHVKLIADRASLPIQGIGPEGTPAQQEASQPPLYYLLSALATFWIDTGPVDSLIWANPYTTMGHPHGYGNKNVVIHTPKEDFPYQGVALAVHISRWLSVLMGAVTVACCFAVVRRVVPSRNGIALAAAAIAAFNPQFLFISAAVNNDNLITMLASLVVLLSIVFVQRGMAVRQAFVLGLVLGLALLSKLTALGLVPVIITAVAMLSLRRRSLSLFMSRISIIAAVSLFVAGWWYLRNWLLYGDFTGLSMMLSIVKVRVPTPSIVDLLSEFQGFRMSFWAVFGWFNILADEWIYPLLDDMMLLALVGLGIASAQHLVTWALSSTRRVDTARSSSTLADGPRRLRKAIFGQDLNPIPSGTLFIIPSLWLIVNFGLFVKWTQTTLASQGRLLFPSLPSITLLLALGLASLVPKRLAWAPLGTVGIFLLGFSALTPSRYILPAYATATAMAEEDVPSHVRRVDLSFDGQMRLIGYDLDKQQLKPGDEINLTLYWQVLAKMDSDHAIFVTFRGRDNQAIALYGSFPGLGRYATSVLKPGDGFAEKYRLAVSKTAEAPAIVRFAVDLYDLSNQKSLPAYDSQSNELGGGPVLSVLRLERITPISRPTHTLANVDFGGVVDLVGYDLNETAVVPGDNLELTLYWRSRQKTDEDYTVFNQLLNQQLQLYGQYDGQPAGGDYPTHAWNAGEVVADRHVIPVRVDTPPGSYSLVTGMYSPAKNYRLNLVEPAGQNYFRVSEIVVVSSP